MTSEAEYSKALRVLRDARARFGSGQKGYDQIVPLRNQVFAKYRPIFSPEHVPNLTKEEFTSFLYFKNNCHWTGLNRQGLGAAGDMKKLRECLAVLLDERQQIRERFAEALPMARGFGKALATGILTVAYPEKYGVWNNTSEKGLRKVGLWPNFERGEGVGGRYEEINRLLRRLSPDLGVDLWTLDALWWFSLKSEP